MSTQLAIDSIQQALMTALWLCLPLLAVLFVVGIAISIVQILTSIQDPAFGAVPRLTAFFAILVISLPWILTRLVDYTVRLLSNLGKYAH